MTKKNREMQERKNKFGGIHFNPFKPKTDNQYEFIRAIAENDITIGEGVSGVGKTFLSIGLACQYLIEGKVKKILVSRSIIGCDNELGFMPGDVGEKIAPYLLPYIEYFKQFIGTEATERHIHYQDIFLYPVELLRGHTYNDTFMILDEAQDTTIKQIKLFLTRMGNGSKVVIVGDTKQTDIEGRNGLDFCTNHMADLRGLGIIKFGKQDVLRHPIIPHILEVFENKGF